MKRREFLTNAFLQPKEKSSNVFRRTREIKLPDPASLTDIKTDVSTFANQTIPDGLDRTQAGITQYAGTFGNAEKIHLLRRTTFGNSFAHLSALNGKTLDEAVDILLSTQTAPAPPINHYNSANFTDPVVPAGETWVNAPPDGNANGFRIQSFKLWWIGLMLNQPLNIEEKMTLFWHNHFATEAQGTDARYVYNHNVLLRKYALGNFRELVYKITVDPLMLQYLNGNQNTKTAPDENYARELQELFTLGKGPDSKYTEDDVKAAARILTGWRDIRKDAISIFDSTRHDTADKQFSSFFNNTVIKGKTGVDGALETDELLDMIFAQQEVAKYVCRRLYRWFVYYVIDDAAEKNVIEPLAQTFRDNNYEIKPVIAELLKSEHFFDAVNRGCVIKSPLDACIGLCRQYNVAFPGSTNYVEQHGMWEFVWIFSALMQQNIGDPPNVAGWPAYWQSPQFYELWINSDTLPKRNYYSDILMVVGYKKNGEVLMVDPIEFTKNFSTPSDPNLLIADALEYLLAIELSDSQKTFLKNILLSNQSADYYWTDAWVNYINDPTDASKEMIVKTRLQALYKYIMNLPEYQLS